MKLPHRKRSLLFSELFILLILIISSIGIKPLLPEKLQQLISSGEPHPQTQVRGTTTQAADMVKVERVVDGDTIVIQGGQKLRYIGINAPESVDPRRSVQCFGKAASARNKELLEGKIIRMEKDISETDKYGRLLRYVYLPADNGQKEVMVNEELVREGYAFAAAYPPDVTYQYVFKAAEEDARSNNRGLWSSCPVDK